MEVTAAMDGKKCVLYEDRICVECGECDMCDLDPNKVCDNCMQCIRSDADYRAIEIDGIFESESEEKYENIDYDE